MENRVSIDQLEALLDFLLEHPAIARGVGLGHRSKEAVDKQWRYLATKLNAFGTGSSKSGERWKKYWADLKHKSKTRLKKWRRDVLGTGGLQGSQDDLSEIDKKVLAIIGEQAVYGDIEHRVPIFYTQVEVPPEPSTSRINMISAEVPAADDLAENCIVTSDVAIENEACRISECLNIVIDVADDTPREVTDRVPQSSQTGVRPKNRPTMERRRLRRTQPISTRIDPQWVMEIETSRTESEKKIADATTVIATAVHELVGVMSQQNMLLNALLEENRELRNRLLNK